MAQLPLSAKARGLASPFTLPPHPTNLQSPSSRSPLFMALHVHCFTLVQPTSSPVVFSKHISDHHTPVQKNLSKFLHCSKVNNKPLERLPRLCTTWPLPASPPLAQLSPLHISCQDSGMHSNPVTRTGVFATGLSPVPLPLAVRFISAKSFSQPACLLLVTGPHLQHHLLQEPFPPLPNCVSVSAPQSACPSMSSAVSTMLLETAGYLVRFN